MRVPAGRIGDIFGHRKALLTGVALIFPVSVSVLTNAFPAVKASRAIGLAYGIAGLGDGTSTGAAIDTILGVLAALLLAASAVVLWVARAPTESARSR